MADEDEPAHSKIGASSAKRWMNCPGSVVLCERAPEQPSSKFAEEGTAAHTLFERCVKKWLKSGEMPDALIYLGERIKVKNTKNKYEVTEEMAEAVNDCLSVVEEFKWNSKKVHLGVESKVHLSWIHPDMFGTIDFHAADLKRRKLTIVDFKYGAGVPVDVYKNEQVLYYCLAIAKKYGIKNFDEFEVIIAQPRADHFEGPIRRWNFDRKTLLKFEQELKAAVLRVEDARADFDEVQLNPGSWCRFCAAAGTCPALRNKALVEAVGDFDDVEDDIEDVYLTPPGELSKERLSQVLFAAEMIDAWVSQVRKYALSEAQNGRIPEGFKLVNKQGRRKWRDLKEVIEKANLCGASAKEIYAPRKLKTPAQLEKVRGLGKKFVSDLTETPNAGAHLRPETDRRASLAPSVIADFADYET